MSEEIDLSKVEMKQPEENLFASNATENVSHSFITVLLWLVVTLIVAVIGAIVWLVASGYLYIPFLNNQTTPLTTQTETPTTSTSTEESAIPEVVPETPTNIATSTMPVSTSSTTTEMEVTNAMENTATSSPTVSTSTTATSTN